MKCVPPAGGNAECCKIAKISTVLRTTTEDIHDITYNSGRVAFSCSRDEADAILGHPGICASIVGPDIIKPVGSVRAAKAV